MTNQMIDGVTSQTFLQGARPSSRNKTTYTCMNDWMRMEGRTMTSQQPVMYSGAQGFTQVPTMESPAHQTSAQANEDFNTKFRRSYSDLAHQIAYRYPNPGLPRIRQGCMGGTWRHIKEVLGHSGSQVCFVDGLVSVYDSDKFNEALQPSLPYKGKLVHPPYAPTKTEFASSRQRVCLPRLDDDINRKLKLNVSPSHRGHYQFK